MSQFKNLVFEGGGVKGIAYAGALKVLEEKSIIPDIRRVAGTSAGAISATLVAMGAGWQEVQQIVGGTNFRKFMDHSWGVIRDTDRLVNKYGWFKGDEFSRWMHDRIKELTGNGDLDFLELRAMARGNPRKYKELSVVCSDLTNQTPIIYSAETSPKLEIWQAVRRSMSIPLFFASCRDNANCVLVDGGVTWNYPLDLYDQVPYLSDKSNTKTFSEVHYPTTKWDEPIYNKETLGLRVDRKDEIATMKERAAAPPVDMDNIVDYLKGILGFMTDMANKAHLHKNDWHRTIFIDALKVGTTDFDLSTQQVNDLVQSGTDCATKYFEWFETASTDEALNKVG